MLATVALGGCGRAEGYRPDDSAAGATASASPSESEAALEEGDCVARDGDADGGGAGDGDVDNGDADNGDVGDGGADAGGVDDGSYRKVSCDSTAARGTVLTMLSADDPSATAANCPVGADFGVEIHRASYDYRLGHGQVVCVRNLKAPHPGDVGQGGGPAIVEGDCLRVTDDAVDEVACRTKGRKDGATHKVVSFLYDQTVISGLSHNPCPDGLTGVSITEVMDVASDHDDTVACAKEL
ncbi:hypothetical protein [Streptomyces sp. NPDC001530]|uniref:hypothetical protein n=1 Tax=Streptomyces sp. NPDC001530 TaxID=3364582 RepID=UPI00369798B4